MTAVVIIVACVCIVVLLAVLLDWYRMRQRRNRFRGRNRLSATEIYRTFYSETGLEERDVTQVWQDIASCLRLDAGMLRPGDRFDDELRPVPWAVADDEISEVFYYATDVSRRNNVSINTKQLQCIDDCVRVLAGAMKKGRNQ